MGKNESAGNLVQTSVDVMMATLARILGHQGHEHIWDIV
jgi:hypothetical protein